MENKKELKKVVDELVTEVDKHVPKRVESDIMCWDFCEDQIPLQNFLDDIKNARERCQGATDFSLFIESDYETSTVTITLYGERDETPQEVKARVEREEKWAEDQKRREKEKDEWEKREYQRLKEKYEGN